MKGQATEREVRLDDGAMTTLASWGEHGPAVLCVHGITSSRNSWLRTASALQGAFRVFAYDQRGHGDSAAVVSPMTLQRSVQDLCAVAVAINEPIALLGHSWGGAVAILGGKEKFVTRVVAIDPMVRVEPGSWRREYLEDAEADLALPWPELETTLRQRLQHWDAVDVAGKLHAMRRMRSEAIANLGADNNVDEGGWDLLESVRAYPKPLLILAAAPGESVLSADDLDSIQRAGGQHITIAQFTDQGHNLHRTAFDRYIAVTREFLQA